MIEMQWGKRTTLIIWINRLPSRTWGISRSGRRNSKPTWPTHKRSIWIKENKRSEALQALSCPTSSMGHLWISQLDQEDILSCQRSQASMRSYREHQVHLIQDLAKSEEQAPDKLAKAISTSTFTHSRIHLRWLVFQGGNWAMVKIWVWGNSRRRNFKLHLTKSLQHMVTRETSGSLELLKVKVPADSRAREGRRKPRPQSR